MMAQSGFAADHLRSFIERIERLEEEKAAVGSDIKEVYSEAKGQGFDTKIMREVVRLRKLDPAALQERDALLDLYRSALERQARKEPTRIVTPHAETAEAGATA